MPCWKSTLIVTILSLLNELVGIRFYHKLVGSSWGFFLGGGGNCSQRRQCLEFQKCEVKNYKIVSLIFFFFFIKKVFPPDLLLQFVKIFNEVGVVTHGCQICQAWKVRVFPHSPWSMPWLLTLHFWGFGPTLNAIIYISQISFVFTVVTQTLLGNNNKIKKSEICYMNAI